MEELRCNGVIAGKESIKFDLRIIYELYLPSYNLTQKSLLHFVTHIMMPKKGPSASCAPVGLHEDPMQEQLLKYGLRMTENGAIKWKNGNINHPRNWPWHRKAYDTAVIIFLDLFT